MILPSNPSARRATAGRAQPGLSEALYASLTPPTALLYATVVKAPARGGGRALRSGAFRRLDSAQQARTQSEASQ